LIILSRSLPGAGSPRLITDEYGDALSADPVKLADAGDADLLVLKRAGLLTAESATDRPQVVECLGNHLDEQRLVLVGDDVEPGPSGGAQSCELVDPFTCCTHVNDGLPTTTPGSTSAAICRAGSGVEPPRVMRPRATRYDAATGGSA